VNSDGIRLGFTGSREGMTDRQKSAFGLWIYGRRFAEFHHGCCVGADAFAVVVILDEAIGRPTVIGHPGDWPPLTDKEACASSAELKPCRPNLERNRNIVDATDHLVACPKGKEEQRSGTWATIRYARKVGRPVTIIWPDGTIEATP
jgi:hypothetical protein